MRRYVMGMALLLLTVSMAHAFEVDGLNSGMSMESAQKVLQGSSYTIQLKENGIIATGGNRFILLNFCKDELILVQKQYAPGFENFVRLVAEMRRLRGKPVDAWTEAADAHLPIERNAVSFLWHDNLDSVKVTHTEFAANKQLDVIYEIKNRCRQLLD